MRLVNSDHWYTTIIEHCPNTIRAIFSIQADAPDCAYTVQNPMYDPMLQSLWSSLMENYFLHETRFVMGKMHWPLYNGSPTRLTSFGPGSFADGFDARCVKALFMISRITRRMT